MLGKFGCLCQAMNEIAEECKENPELFKEAPLTTPVKRVDEVRAVKVLNQSFRFQLIKVRLS
jgi:glycine dehydrogenase subunit 2